MRGGGVLSPGVQRAEEGGTHEEGRAREGGKVIRRFIRFERNRFFSISFFPFFLLRLLWQSPLACMCRFCFI